MRNEVQYLETRIAKEMKLIESLLSNILFADTLLGTIAEEYEGDLREKQIDEKNECRRRMKKLINFISVYLEKINSPVYLEKFNRELVPKMNDQIWIFESDYAEDADLLYSTSLPEIWSFLEPFQFTESLDYRTGVKYLENILTNTASIINAYGKTPHTEPEVYNIVKPVIYAVFPRAKDAKSNFIKTAKSYKPDVLVPELEAAVEYKYAEQENRLKESIDEICADQKGYTGDSDYNLFYAIFYVTNDFWGKPKFEAVWKDLAFPTNWRGFYIVA